MQKLYTHIQYCWGEIVSQTGDSNIHIHMSCNVAFGHCVNKRHDRKCYTTQNVKIFCSWKVIY